MCPSRPTLIDPVGMNLPEAVAEADGAGIGVGLGGAPTLVDPVGLGPPVGEDVVPVPEQAAAAKATDKIASAAGLTRERGTLPAVPCRIIVATPPAWQLMAAPRPRNESSDDRILCTHSWAG